MSYSVHLMCNFFVNATEIGGTYTKKRIDVNVKFVTRTSIIF